MSTHYIRIYYGPVNSFGVSSEHRPQFLNGLRDRLRQLGNRVDIIPVKFMNLCVVECCGYIMFRCNIKSLCFNTPYHFDPVCKNAVDAVLIGIDKLQRARTYLWIWNLVDNQIFNRSEYSSKDYWISELPPLIQNKELDNCAKCCSLLTAIEKVPSHERFFKSIGKTYAISQLDNKKEWTFTDWFPDTAPKEVVKEMTEEEQRVADRIKGIVRAPRISYVANRPPPIAEDRIRAQILRQEEDEKLKSGTEFKPVPTNNEPGRARGHKISLDLSS